MAYHSLMLVNYHFLCLSPATTFISPWKSFSISWAMFFFCIQSVWGEQNVVVFYEGQHSHFHYPLLKACWDNLVGWLDGSCLGFSFSFPVYGIMMYIFQKVIQVLKHDFLKMSSNFFWGGRGAPDALAHNLIWHQVFIPSYIWVVWLLLLPSGDIVHAFSADFVL